MTRARCPTRDLRAARPLVAFQLIPSALVQVVWRAHPAQRAAPLVLVDTQGTIRAASPLATGVRPGQTLAQARGHCPTLIPVPGDERAATLLYAEMLRSLTAFSPLI